MPKSHQHIQHGHGQPPSLKTEMSQNNLCICIYSTKHLACTKALGMEDHTITDEQITASSEWDVDEAAFHGRLHFQETAIQGGGWGAGENDSNQWLQVDLGSLHTKVTSVATQGRNGSFDEWVTKYKLQYSNNGVSFTYYREPGEAADKVK